MNFCVSRRSLLTGAAALAAQASPLLPSFARAQAPEAVDALGRGLVEAINDPARLEPFVTALASPAALQRHPVAEWRDSFAAIREASGGVDFLRARRFGNEVAVEVRTRRQQLSREVRVLMDRQAADRAWMFIAAPMPSTYDGPLPARRMSHALLAQAIDRRLAYARKRDEFSGAVRVVSPGGAVVFEKAYGLANRDEAVAMTPAHRMHLGSADKSFTAILVGKLIEQGRLGLDARLVDVLPDYPNPDAAQKITVRRLLTHSAGLGDLFDRPLYDRRKDIARVAELLPVFAAAPLRYDPGARSAYSNEGFVVLGAIVEKLTGEPWWDTLAREVYAPAGMSHSGHFRLDETVARRAVGYRYLPDDILGLNPRHPNWDFLGVRGNSCGGGYSTVADMTGYLRALRDGKLLKRATADLFTGPSADGLKDYGMGFQCVSLGGRTIRGHGGGGPQSGVDGRHGIVWETGWAYSVLGNYDAPFAQRVAEDLHVILAAQD